MFWLQIDWSSFSWQAFATLATGLAAVFAAWRVGNRQISLLAEQQKYIKEQGDQARDIKLQELRIALVDRRSECIRIMIELNQVFIRDAGLGREQWPELTRVLNSSRLIFPMEISDDIKQILDASVKYQHYSERSIYYHRKKYLTKAGELSEKAQDEENKIFELMPTMVDRLEEYTRI
jgi:hypothetical protein